MKTTLTHLPDEKQEELKSLTEIILEKVPAEMIILFGSHARGDWVEDFQENTEYVSDYDILVITKDRKSAKADEKSGGTWKRIGNNGNDEQQASTLFIIAFGL
jgi:predicted nucleotidyltransferase